MLCVLRAVAPQVPEDQQPVKELQALRGQSFYDWPELKVHVALALTLALTLTLILTLTLTLSLALTLTLTLSLTLLLS